MTATQRRLIVLMRSGKTLMWWGDNGPELSGHPFWPQKRTVRSLIEAGVLRWGEANNETQRQCGIFPILLTEPAGGAEPQTQTEETK